MYQLSLPPKRASCLAQPGSYWIPLVLLVLGVTGFAGTALIGRFLGPGLYRTLITIPALMALIAGR